MKKVNLICAVVLVGLSLGGCGNGHHYNLQKLRAEHSRLLKQTKKKDHKHNKKHSAKSKKSTKQSASNKNSSSSKKDKASSSNGQQSNSQQASQDEYKGMHLSPEQQANVNKGLYPNGTRRPESFANQNDYKRYNAWYQGYNYDPNTNTYSRMNDQQLNDMRQQMNANGGQNFQ